MAEAVGRVPRTAQGSDAPGAEAGERAPDTFDLRAVYDRWAPLVRAVVSRRLGDRLDVEDATQLVFLAAWRARDRFDPRRGDLPVWLLGITRHVTADVLAAREREARRREAASRRRLPTAVPDPADDVAARVDLEGELRRLAPERRRVVRLVYAHDRTHVQVAAETGLPLGTVKSHARRGLAQLRRP
jgi:RNA polymerase sigma-70 factor (ECF subfamily)